MTLYLTSDLHVDHYVENRNKISTFINRYLPSCDVLCVAGDTADNPKIFIDFYRLASVKYKHIFLIFENHDLTVKHDNCFLTNPFPLTEEKLNWIKEKLSELQNVTLLDGTTAKIGKSKLPPAEPVALIRHKWPATSCDKPLRNASHRDF